MSSKLEAVLVRAVTEGWLDWQEAIALQGAVLFSAYQLTYRHGYGDHNQEILKRLLDKNRKEHSEHISDQLPN